MQKIINIDAHIKQFCELNEKRIYFYKFSAIGMCSFLWQKQFIEDTFDSLLYEYIKFFKNFSLKNFLKFYFILFYFFTNPVLLIKILNFLNLKNLKWIIFILTLYINDSTLINFFEILFFKFKFKKLNKANFVYILKIYIFLKYDTQEMQNSKRYRLNNINNLFILFNLYLFEFCISCLNKFSYNIWIYLINSNIIDSVLFFNHIYEFMFINKKTQNQCLNNFYFKKLFNFIQLNNKSYLKSWYYFKIKLFKQIFKNYYDKNVKAIKINVYKKIYFYFKISFKTQLCIL